MMFEEDRPVAVEFAGRMVDGVVDDIRWSPRINATPEETTAIAVDVGATTVVAAPADITPR
ncbi:hypothetical protein [Halostella sp. PRR32]|uniref:hypothetical protein n=1 Tax=Halostella sp. PRR32 TaxID=3098147 RepID=UPI002B1CF417|nr:hypothetical protein [Halostella sp. PRR32]